MLEKFASAMFTNPNWQSRKESVFSTEPFGAEIISKPPEERSWYTVATREDASYCQLWLIWILRFCVCFACCAVYICDVQKSAISLALQAIPSMSQGKNANVLVCPCILSFWVKAHKCKQAWSQTLLNFFFLNSSKKNVKVKSPSKGHHLSLISGALPWTAPGLNLAVTTPMILFYFFWLRAGVKKVCLASPRQQEFLPWSIKFFVCTCHASNPTKNVCNKCKRYQPPLPWLEFRSRRFRNPTLITWLVSARQCQHVAFHMGGTIAKQRRNTTLNLVAPNAAGFLSGKVHLHHIPLNEILFHRTSDLTAYGLKLKASQSESWQNRKNPSSRKKNHSSFCGQAGDREKRFNGHKSQKSTSDKPEWGVCCTTFLSTNNGHSSLTAPFQTFFCVSTLRIHPKKNTEAQLPKCGQVADDPQGHQETPFISAHWNKTKHWQWLQQILSCPSSLLLKKSGWDQSTMSERVNVPHCSLRPPEISKQHCWVTWAQTFSLLTFLLCRIPNPHEDNFSASEP